MPGTDPSVAAHEKNTPRRPTHTDLAPSLAPLSYTKHHAALSVPIKADLLDHLVATGDDKQTTWRSRDDVG